MNTMIDVHVLTLPNDRQDWFKQCMASSQNQPIEVHVLAGVQGHIGKGRVNGFMAGKKPYVSLVDPDDIVTQNGFRDCLALLQEHPELHGAYTAEDQSYQDDFGVWRVKKADPMKGSLVHHLLVLRREVAEQYFMDLLDHPQYPETAMLNHMKRDGVNLGYTHSVGYVWRRYQKVFNYGKY